MASVILYPSSDDVISGLTWKNTTNYFQAIDDLQGAYDDLTTYISNSGGAGTTTIITGHPTFSPYQAETVSDVKWEVRSRRELLINPHNYLRVSGSDYWDLTHAGGWTTQSTNSGTNPNTTNPWQPADIDNIQFKFYCSAAGAGQYANCTAQNITVTYLPGAGGFAYLISQLLPPLIAWHGLTMQEIARLSQFGRLKATTERELRYLKENYWKRPKRLELRLAS